MLGSGRLLVVKEREGVRVRQAVGSQGEGRR